MSKSKEQIMDTRNADNIQHSNSLNILKTPLSKIEIAGLVDKTCQLIMDGEIDPIRAELCLKAMENIIKDIRSNSHVKRITSEEAKKYGKTFSLFGAEITNSSRTTYDYSDCGDEIYNDLIAQQEKIKEQIKIREAIIKSGVDSSTGQCFNEPKTSTTEFLTIKFK